MNKKNQKSKYKTEMERINYMKEYKRNQEILFTKKNAKEVSVMGELLTMNSKVKIKITFLFLF